MGACGGLNPARGAAGVVDARVPLAARAYQGIVLSALSKVDLGELVETGLSGMVAARGVAGCCLTRCFPAAQAGSQGCPTGLRQDP